MPHCIASKAVTLLFGGFAALLSVSPASAENYNKDVVRDRYGSVLVNTFDNCVRTRWSSASDPCGVQPAVARTILSQEERTVYFDFNKATLSTSSTNKLNSLADKLKSDGQVQQARIIGYADRIGSPSYNEQLSKRRAENVRSYLVSRGFIKGRVADTRWLGESVPATQCPDSLSRTQLIECLQKDRRVEVELDYLPVKRASQ